MHISLAAFDEMVAARRAFEALYVVRTLRERGDALASKLGQAALEREVRETLAVCDRLGLTSDVDRLTFCMLEITCFAGLRDLPKLGGLLNYAGGPPDARMQALLEKMPPPVWEQLSRGAVEVRAKRGWA
jgi:hypothetical protein